MKKISLFFIALISMFAFAFGVNAKEVSNEEQFIEALKTDNNITITEDFEVAQNITLDKKIVLDLNNHTISFASGKFILLKGGNLEITGKGTMAEIDPYFAPVLIKGSTNEEDTNYSTLTVGKDVVLKGWSGIFIDKFNGPDKISNSYGITVNLYGTAIGMTDSTGETGYGIYENGSIAHLNNAPVVNIYDGAVVYSPRIGIYAAGYGTWNIKKANISGKTGIEIRAGILNIDGATIKGDTNGVKVVANNDGPTTEGVGIAVSQHTTKNILKVNITSGSVEGTVALYESNPQKNNEEALEKITLNVTGGTFKGASEKTGAVYSENKTSFITGGTFSFDVANYTNDKYITTLTKEGYVVEPHKEEKTTDSSNTTGTIKAETPFEKDLYLEINRYEEEAVKEVTEQITEKYKNEKTMKDIKLIGLYEINMVDGTSVVPMENGKFTISIEIDKQLRNYKNYKVLYFDEDGKLKEEYKATLDNGMITFTTSHLSDYAIVGYNDATINPNTADNIMIYAVTGLVALGAILGLGICLKKKESN